MNYKTTLVLLTFVAAGAVVYWLGPDVSPWLGLAPAPPSSTDAGTLRTLQDLTADNLDRIEIQQGQRAVVLERGPGGEWTLPGKWPARKAEVDDLVQLLTHLRSRFLPLPLGNPAELAQYGLDHPPVLVTIRVANTSHRLAFGEESGGSNRFSRPTYVRLDDNPEVLRLAPGLVAALDRPQDHYQQRRLFPSERVAQDSDSQEKVDRLVAQAVAVKGPTSHFRIAKASANWQLEDPVQDNLDPEKLKAILNAVPDIWAEQFVDHSKKDLAEYGLKDPEQTLQVTRSSGETTLLIGKPSQTRTRTITRPAPSLGGPPLPPQREVIHDEYRYAKLKDNDQIFEIKADRLKDVFVAADSLRDANLTRFHSEDARRLEINHEGQTILLVKEKEKWRLQAPLQADADRAAITELLDKLSNLQARDKDVIDHADAKTYGLEKPTATIQVTVAEENKSAGDPKDNKTKQVTFNLGKHDTDKAKLYVRVADRDRINAVEDSLLKLVQRPALAYRPLQLWQYSVGDIQELRVRKGEQEYQLKRADQGWKIGGPFDADALADQVRPMIEELATLRCERYAAPAATDLAAYGLDQPILRLTLSTAKKGDPKEETSSRTLLVGKPTETNGQANFAKLEEDPAVFVLTAKSVTAVNHPALDLLDRQLLTLQPDMIQQIQQKRDGGTLTLERKDAQWQVVEPPVASFLADRETMAAVLSAWSNLRAQRVAAYGPQVDLSRYGLDEPTARITITLKPAADKDKAAKPSEHTLLLGNTIADSPGDRFARLDDRPSVFVLAANLTNDLTHGYLDFVDRTVFQFDAAKVMSIERHMGNESLEIIKRDKAWQLVKPSDLTADVPTLDEIIGQLGQLRAKRVAAYPAKELAPFQLDKPVATLTVRIAGIDGKLQERLLKIGKAIEEAKGDGDRFAAAGEGTTIFVLPGSLARRLTAPPLQFQDRNFAHFGGAERVILARDRRKATFAKVDGTWKLMEPVEAETEQSELDEFVNAAAHLRADELVADKPADLKPYGLDRPLIRWRFQSGDKELLNLLIGGREKHGARCYAKLADRDMVFLLSPQLTAEAEGEYRKRTFWAPLDAVQIEKLSYGYPDKPFVLEKVESDWHIAGKPDSKVQPEAIRETLDALAGLKAAQYVMDKNADLKLFGLEPPQLILEIHTRTGTRRLDIGRPEGESKRQYAHVPESNNSAVFTISEADAGRILRPLSGFLQHEPKPSNPSTPMPHE